MGGKFSDPARPPSGTPVRGSRDEESPASFVIPNTRQKFASILLGWTAVRMELGVTVVVGNQIHDEKVSNHGGGGEESNAWYRRNDER